MTIIPYENGYMSIEKSKDGIVSVGYGATRIEAIKDNAKMHEASSRRLQTTCKCN